MLTFFPNPIKHNLDSFSFLSKNVCCGILVVYKYKGWHRKKWPIQAWRKSSLQAMNLWVYMINFWVQVGDRTTHDIHNHIFTTTSVTFYMYNWVQHHECLQGQTVNAVISVYTIHCVKTMKTLKIHRILGERWGRQWDAARWNTLLPAFYPNFKCASYKHFWL